MTLNVEALSRLADLLEGKGYYEENPADLTDFSTSDWAVCAIGAACRDFWFRERGFRFSPDDLVPTYNGSRSWKAVYDFFSIEPAYAIEVFFCTNENGMAEKDPSKVASALRALIV
jgi:hypothetical protein